MIINNKLYSSNLIEILNSNINTELKWGIWSSILLCSRNSRDINRYAQWCEEQFYNQIKNIHKEEHKLIMKKFKENFGGKSIGIIGKAIWNINRTCDGVIVTIEKISNNIYKITNKYKNIKNINKTDKLIIKKCFINTENEHSILLSFDKNFLKSYIINDFVKF